jgi:uncharacterized Tic20 family protein
MSIDPMRSYASSCLAPISGAERAASAVAHASIVLGFPFLGPIGVLLLYPLIVGPSAYVRQQAMQALLFHLFVSLVTGVLFAVAWFCFHILILIGWPIALVAGLAGLGLLIWGWVVELIATVKAFQGQPYALPVVGGVSR